MDIVSALSTLRRRKLLILLALAAGVVVGIVSIYRVSLSPLDLRGRGLEYGAASATMTVDTRESPLGSAAIDLGPINQRAQILVAQLSGSQVQRRVAEALKVPPGDVSIAAPTVDDSARTGAARSVQLIRETSSYRAALTTTLGSPVIQVQATAPDAEGASRLVSAILSQGSAVINDDIPRSKDPAFQVVVRPLSQPTSGLVNPGTNPQAAAGIAAVVALLTMYLLLFVARSLEIARGRRAQGDVADRTTEGGTADPALPVADATESRTR